MKTKIVKFSAPRIMAAGFALAIFAGALLLWLPISSAPGEETSFLDALFTATTSVCVTGLVTVPTFSHWSLFGHIIILILIQLGGLGVITCSMLAFLALGRRISLKNRRLIQESYNLDHLSGMVRIVRKVVIGTFLVEFLGMVFYSFQFVPEFGWGKGLWQSLFTSVSAFCNAGIDILGPDSLHAYVHNPIINFTTMFLIVMGGLGFIVWFDIVDRVRDLINKKIKPHMFWRRLQLHSKLAITMTVLLLVWGTVIILFMERNNPDTIGTYTLWDKIMAALFQSVTTRTAGFETISQGSFRDSTSVFHMILMFIGGSPMGTAGGMKTTTVAVVLLTAGCYYRGKKQTSVFNRQVVDYHSRTAFVVVCTGLVILFTMVFLVSAATGGDYMDVAYEVTSAVGTVGLTRAFTPTMNALGKLLIIITMYIGRIGPITLASAVAIQSRETSNSIEYPTEKIIIG